MNEELMRWLLDPFLTVGEIERMIRPAVGVPTGRQKNSGSEEDIRTPRRTRSPYDRNVPLPEQGGESGLAPDVPDRPATRVPTSVLAS